MKQTYPIYLKCSREIDFYKIESEKYAHCVRNFSDKNGKYCYQNFDEGPDKISWILERGDEFTTISRAEYLGAVEIQAKRCLQILKAIGASI